MIEFSPNDALLVVDVQRDFCPGGALAVDEGDEIVEPLNALMEQAEQAGAVIAASRDWHPPGHCSFKAQGGPWPEHCVQETPGARLHPDLRLPDEALLVSKGQTLKRDQYSAFDGTELAEHLRGRGVKRVWIGGLALDVCVRATALEAAKAGFETHVILDATRHVEESQAEATVAELRGAGVELDRLGA